MVTWSSLTLLHVQHSAWFLRVCLMVTTSCDIPVVCFPTTCFLGTSGVHAESPLLSCRPQRSQGFVTGAASLAWTRATSVQGPGGQSWEGRAEGWGLT